MLTGLLLIRHAAAPPACPGAGAHCAQRPRKVRGRPDDRRSYPDHQRTRTRADPLHPAGTRAATPDQPAQVSVTAPATAQDRRRRSTQPTPAVVKTFPSNPLINNGHQTKNGPNPRSRVNGRRANRRLRNRNARMTGAPAFTVAANPGFLSRLRPVRRAPVLPVAVVVEDPVIRRCRQPNGRQPTAGNPGPQS